MRWVGRGNFICSRNSFLLFILDIYINTGADNTKTFRACCDMAHRDTLLGHNFVINSSCESGIAGAIAKTFINWFYSKSVFI